VDASLQRTAGGSIARFQIVLAHLQPVVFLGKDGPQHYETGSHLSSECVFWNIMDVRLGAVGGDGGSLRKAPTLIEEA